MTHEAPRTAPTEAEIRAMTDLICVCGMRCSCGARERLQAIREKEATRCADSQEDEGEA